MKNFSLILFVSSFSLLFSQLCYADNGTEKQILFRVDSSASQVLITVRRGGLLARLGHDHIVSSHKIEGSIIMQRASNSNSKNYSHCRADFSLPLASLVVDNPQLRAEAGFTTTPSKRDIKGTTRNMLKAIDADKFPYARVQSQNCLPALRGEETEMVVSLHGAEKNLKLAMDVDLIEGELLLRGSFSLQQSDFGIEPLSIMGGLLKVEDKLELSFKIALTKVEENQLE